jgi:hypothetical protein
LTDPEAPSGADAVDACARSPVVATEVTAGEEEGAFALAAAPAAETMLSWRGKVDSAPVSDRAALVS